jgi:hypothetical protein
MHVSPTETGKAGISVVLTAGALGAEIRSGARVLSGLVDGLGRCDHRGATVKDRRAR